MISRSFFGGDEEDRTLYLLNAIQALSQVSYAPGTAPAFFFVGGDYNIIKDSSCQPSFLSQNEFFRQLTSFAIMMKRWLAPMPEK